VGLSVTMLPGKCLLTMVSRDSSGKVLSDPSGFLTSPSLFESLEFRILDNFAIAGSVSTSLTNSWNLVFLASFMQFLSDLFRVLRSFKSTGEGRPCRYAFFLHRLIPFPGVFTVFGPPVTLLFHLDWL
jgi:hypothetical protein